MKGQYNIQQMDLTANYRDLFESLPGRYIAFLPDDPFFTIIAENRAHAKVAMVAPKDILGKPLLEAFPDTSDKFIKTGKSDLLTSIREVIKTKRSISMPVLRYDMKNKKGEMVEKYWRITNCPVLDSNNEISMLYQVSVDITDAVKNENLLARTQRQLSDALSIASIGLWSWDIGTDKVIADKNLLRMFGLDTSKHQNEIALSAFIDRIHPDDKDNVLAEINKAAYKTGKFNIEYRTIDKDEDVHWLSAKGKLYTDEQNNPISLAGSLIDITDRKISEINNNFLMKASVELASSLDYKKTLQNIAELAVPTIADWCSIEILENNTLEQVAVVHKDPKKVQWAKAFRKEQGPPNKDASTGSPKVLRTGKTEYYPVITDDTLVNIAKNQKSLKLLRGLGLSSAIVVPLKIRGKTTGTISLVSAEQKRRFNKLDLYMAEELANRASLAMTNANLYESAQEEILKRERLQDELKISNQNLEQRVKRRTVELVSANTNLKRSNDELETFAYIASHDLQEPLRKVQAFSNLLKTEYSEQLGEGADYVDRMHNAAVRMSSLIEDLLAFSRVTTKSSNFEPVDLNKIANEVINDLETLKEETNGKIILSKLPVIGADPVQIRQLFQNLIGNALKFHKDNQPPKVKVSASSKIFKDKNEYCKITVEDNGVGFDEKYLDRIFAVFQRLHGRNSFEGTGIGLAVCKKIVERHGGDITAKSKPGAGSKFIITLPVKQEEKNGR